MVLYKLGAQRAHSAQNTPPVGPVSSHSVPDHLHSCGQRAPGHRRIPRLSQDLQQPDVMARARQPFERPPLACLSPPLVAGKIRKTGVLKHVCAERRYSALWIVEPTEVRHETLVVMVVCAGAGPCPLSARCFVGKSSVSRHFRSVVTISLALKSWRVVAPYTRAVPPPPLHVHIPSYCRSLQGAFGRPTPSPRHSTSAHSRRPLSAIIGSLSGPFGKRSWQSPLAADLGKLYRRLDLVAVPGGLSWQFWSAADLSSVSQWSL